ncbi:MAG: M48 family metallopeptidase [bacterium]|nr:M48 family metallopeptidase [Betaproteobacteria bacterium]
MSDPAAGPAFAPGSAPVDVRYFDGRSARPVAALLSVEDGIARLEGESLSLRVELHQLRVSEAMARGPRLVTLPDGSHCEVDDAVAFAALLDRTGYREPLVSRLQSRWRNVLLAVLAVVAISAAGVYWGVPAAAGVIARQVPIEIETSLGERALAVLDGELMRPSTLDPAVRERLAARFAAIVPPEGRPYRVEFRRSMIGPNAFALPGGTIVITDELVEIAGSDDAVVAAFAHEVGHVHHRHVMRRLIASAIVGSGAAVLFGDWSSLLAGVPAVLIELHYSRSMEIEADDFARDLLARNGIPVQALVDMLEALAGAGPARAPGPSAREEAAQAPAEAQSPARAARLQRYLQTHPDMAERIERLRAPGML